MGAEEAIGDMAPTETPATEECTYVSQSP